MRRGRALARLHLHLHRVPSRCSALHLHLHLLTHSLYVPMMSTLMSMASSGMEVVGANGLAMAAIVELAASGLATP